MKTSTSIAALAAALAKAQGALEGAKKDSTNPHFKSRYADLASVVEAVKGCFPANGLSYVQTVVTAESGVGVETMLLHASGEWICGEPFYVPVDRANAQGFGSALTYCRRYSLAAIAGVAPEDDDGNAATSAPPSKTGFSGPISGATVVRAEFDKMDPDEQDFIRSHADAVKKLFDTQKDMHAYIESQHLDAEEKMALWSLLPSNVRAAIKKQAPKPALASQA